MWRIVSRRSGQAAYPTHSTIIRRGVDPERFAHWVFRNDKYDVTIPLYIYLPADPATCERLLFSIHGRERNGSKYRNIFVNDLQDKNVFLLAPQFRDGVFASSLALTLGNMRRTFSAKQQIPHELWTFNIIDYIFRLVAQEYPSIKKYAVFGHSAGAQFAHRLIMFGDHPELEVVVAANPGWLTVLDREIDFPYGIRHTFSDDQVKQMLAKRLVLMAGEQDIEIGDNVRLSSGAMVQGFNRFERAHHAFEKAKELARTLQVPINWRLVTVPDLPHSAKGAAPAALPHLLD